MFDNIPKLKRLNDLNVWLNLQDARSRSIQDGDRVRVYNDRGQLIDHGQSNGPDHAGRRQPGSRRLVLPGRKGNRPRRMRQCPHPGCEIPGRGLSLQHLFGAGGNRTGLCRPLNREDGGVLRYQIVTNSQDSMGDALRTRLL